MRPVYTITTNRNCNMACSYCFERNKCGEVNRLDDCAEFLRACFEMDRKDLSCPRLCLCGGETFLVPELLDGIMEVWFSLRHRHGFSDDLESPAEIVTNGTLIAGRKDVQDFIRKWGKRLKLKISLSGDKTAHDRLRRYSDGRGTWDDAVAGLMWAKPFVRRAYAHMVVAKSDLPRIGQFMIAAFEQGFCSVNIKAISEENWPEELAEPLADALEPVQDYIFKNRLYRDAIIPFPQIMTGNRTPHPDFETTGHCLYFRELGLNRLIYRCHRLSHITPPLPCARLENGKIVPFKTPPDKVLTDYWNERPEKCRLCEAKCLCDRCLQTIRFAGGTAAYDTEHSKCGWGKGILLAKKRYAERRSAGGL